MKRLLDIRYPLLKTDDVYNEIAEKIIVIMIMGLYIFAGFKLGFFFSTFLFLILIVPVGFPLAFLIVTIVNLVKFFIIRNQRKTQKLT